VVVRVAITLASPELEVMVALVVVEVVACKLAVVLFLVKGSLEVVVEQEAGLHSVAVAVVVAQALLGLTFQHQTQLLIGVVVTEVMV
jgi:hypothetical protein